jgi:hypothetical protein
MFMVAAAGCKTRIMSIPQRKAQAAAGSRLSDAMT